jgi:hypothetical protein
LQNDRGDPARGAAVWDILVPTEAVAEVVVEGEAVGLMNLY